MTEPSAVEPKAVAIRRAVPADARAAADVYLAAFKATYDFCLLYTSPSPRD